MPFTVVAICSGMLLLALAPLPYGYYVLLRFVACGTFAWAAFIAHERRNPILPWLFALLSITFNPFIPIHFEREIWAVVDIFSSIFILASWKWIKP